MSMIPEVKCRRCGETFSSMRSRCPNCGTRRVAQSGRTPGTSPGTVKGTAAYERAETNTKWQMIFGLILVVAVILAVIVMVSTSLNGTDTGNIGRVTPPVDVSVVPTIEAAPTPSPTPTPSVQRIDIYYYETLLGLESENVYSPTHRVGMEPLPVKAIVYPMDLGVTSVTWSVDPENEDIVKLTPGEDGLSCTIEVLEAKPGGVLIYAEAFGVQGRFLLYCAAAE